jgi:hypothetical protein
MDENKTAESRISLDRADWKFIRWAIEIVMQEFGDDDRGYDLLKKIDQSGVINDAQS